MSFGNLGTGKELEMYKKIVLGIKFVVFISIVGTVALRGNYLISSAFNNLPGWDDLRYMVGLYEEETIETTSLPVANVPEEVAADLIEEPILDYGMPTRITMSSVNIDLPIELGVYNYENQVWTISKGKAYFAELSDLPSVAESSTVIYAHNQWTEFFKTKNLKIGDKIIVETDKGNILTYEYVSDELVDPSWGALFDQEFETSRLTLITCNGVYNENRRLVYADLVSVISGEKSVVTEVVENKDESSPEETVSVEESVISTDEQETAEQVVIEQPVVEQIAPSKIYVESNTVVYGRPLLINIDGIFADEEIRQGWLTKAQLGQMNISNDYVAIAKDSDYVEVDGGNVILFFNSNAGWIEVNNGMEISIETHAEQKLSYTISSNELVSYEQLQNNLSENDGKQLYIVVQESDGIRLIAANFSKVYSIK